jgi:hypothetical protein
MSEDWDETELQWFLVRRAEMFYVHRPRITCATSPTTTRCGPGGCDPVRRWS